MKRSQVIFLLIIFIFILFTHKGCCIERNKDNKGIHLSGESYKYAPFPESSYHYNANDTLDIFRSIGNTFNNIIYFFEVNF